MVVEQEDFNNHDDNETTKKAEENYMESGGRRITAKELLTNPNEKTSMWKKLGMAVIALLVDTGLPLAFYFILRLVIDPMLAMLISGIPALLICVIKIIWKRQLSVMALIIFFGFVLGASIALATDDPRLLLLEKSLMMGVVGFLHVVSLCPIPLYSVKINRKKSYKEFITFTKMGKLKPFLFYNMLQLYPLEDMNPDYTNGEKVGMYQWLWDNIRVFRVHLYIITAVVGLSLAGEFIIKCFMIYSSLSIDDVMVYSNIIFIIIMILTIVFCVVYVFLAKRGFYRHVDEWIANNYETKRNNTEEKRETPPAATYLLFNKVEDDKYDPLL